MLLCIVTIFRFCAFPLVFNLYNRYTCLSRFIPRQRQTRADEQLVTDPPSGHRGIKLPTGSTVNSLPSNSQSTVLSSAGYDHECLNLIYPFRTSRHLLFVRHVLVLGHSDFIRFVILVFLTCKRREDKIILLLSAASEAPQRKTNLHGQINRRD